MNTSTCFTGPELICEFCDDQMRLVKIVLSEEVEDTPDHIYEQPHIDYVCPCGHKRVVLLDDTNVTITLNPTIVTATFNKD